MPILSTHDAEASTGHGAITSYITQFFWLGQFPSFLGYITNKNVLARQASLFSYGVISLEMGPFTTSRVFLDVLWTVTIEQFPGSTIPVVVQPTNYDQHLLSCS